MNDRDIFAAVALHGLIVSHYSVVTSDLTYKAFALADDMLGRQDAKSRYIPTCTAWSSTTNRDHPPTACSPYCTYGR